MVCDYATQYPEAIALHSIDAEHIAEELVKLFARVGVPKEILTDQGSIFTSQLLGEVTDYYISSRSGRAPDRRTS